MSDTSRESDLILEISQLRADLSALKGEREWLEIETAPTDGTVIALWDDRQHVAFTGFYGRPAFQGSMWWMSNGNIMHPTHWSPLPTRVAALKGAQALEGKVGL